MLIFNFHIWILSYLLITLLCGKMVQCKGGGRNPISVSSGENGLLQKRFKRQGSQWVGKVGNTRKGFLFKMKDPWASS